MILILNVDTKGGRHGCGWCQFLSVEGRNATCNLFHVDLPLQKEDGDRILVFRCQQCFDQEALSVERRILEDRDVLKIEIKKQTVIKN
jgi:hypothetical protein